MVHLYKPVFHILGKKERRKPLRQLNEKLSVGEGIKKENVAFGHDWPGCRRDLRLSRKSS